MPRPDSGLCVTQSPTKLETGFETAMAVTANDVRDVDLHVYNGDNRFDVQPCRFCDKTLVGFVIGSLLGLYPLELLDNILLGLLQLARGYHCLL